MKNIYLNHTLKEYNAKYSNRKYRLLKFTKKEVEEHDKKCPYKAKGYILEGRKWWLIKDTYYEIPKAPRYTWFRNLNGAVQASICLLGAGAVTAAIVTPTVLLSSKVKGDITPTIQGTGKDLVESVTLNKQSDGSYTGKIVLKETAKVEEIESITIEVTENEQTTELTRDKDYTLDVSTGDIKINAGVIKTSNPKIAVNVQKAEKTKKYTITAIAGTGGTVSPEEQEYDKGDIATVTATADSGYKFVGWFEDGEKIEGADAEYSFKVTCKRTLTAKFEEDVPGEKLAFTPISGTNNCSVKAAKGAKISGTLEIPSKATIDGKEYTVTIIEYSGFRSQTGITEVILNEGLKEINEYAFSKCDSLTKVSFPASLERVYGNSFYNTSLTSITIDSNNEKYDCRNNCNALVSKEYKEIVLGCGTTTFPETVVGIGNAAFTGSLSVTTMNIPSHITYVDERAFSQCENMESLTLNEGLESIGVSAFYGCRKVSSVHIPASVEYIGSGSFGYCGYLETITVDENNEYYDSRNGCDAIINTRYNELIVGCKTTVIPSDIVTIGYGAFYDCDGLINITIPNSVTKIDNYAFEGCFNLGSDESTLVMPSNLRSIGVSAFFDCYSLKNITLNEGLKEIWNSAFMYCDSLEEIVFPSTLTQIGNSAFKCCESLESVSIPASVYYLGYGAFYESGLKRCYFKDTTNKKWLFDEDQDPETPFVAATDDQENKGEIGPNASTLVESNYDYAKNIEIDADYYYYGFDDDGPSPDWEATSFEVYCINKRACTKAVIPANHPNYESVKVEGLYYDENHYEFELNNGGAFSDTSRLTSLSYENNENLKYIGYECFINSNLKYVLIPKNVVWIASYAFKGCAIDEETYQTKDFQVEFENPYSFWTVGDDLFLPYVEEQYENSGFYVNAYYLDYDYVDSFALSTDDDFVLAEYAYHGFSEDGAEILDETKFSDAAYFEVFCTNKDECTKAVIPDKYLDKPVTGFYYDTYKEEGAFENCTRLFCVEFKNQANITQINDEAFNYCYYLSSFQMPKNIKYIGRLAFYACSHIRYITIPASVEVISKDAFEGCYNPKWEDVNLYKITFEEKNTTWYEYNGTSYVGTWSPNEDPFENVKYLTSEDHTGHSFIKVEGTELIYDDDTEEHKAEMKKEDLKAGTTLTFMYHAGNNSSTTGFLIGYGDTLSTLLDLDSENYKVYIQGKEFDAWFENNIIWINTTIDEGEVVKIVVNVTKDATQDMVARAYPD